MKLIPINLNKGTKHRHPDINVRSWFIAEIKGHQESTFLIGTFSEQWYGFNFDCDWGCSGLQYDTPGSNKSDWKRLWRVEGAKSRDSIQGKLIRGWIKTQ